MRTLKTYMVSALTVGAMSVSLTSTDALAGHDDGPGKGYGKQYVDVYVDAGRDNQLERAIGAYLVEYNPYINLVYSPYYADVTVKVDGYLSAPEIYRKGNRYGKRHRNGRNGYASMGYNYKVRVKAGGRTIYKDRIYGEVSRPLGNRYDRNNNSGGYHRNSGKAEKALGALSIFIDIASDGKINHNYGRPGYGNGYGKGSGYRPDIYRIERQLRRDAIAEVAAYVGHIRIPRKYGRY